MKIFSDKLFGDERKLSAVLASLSAVTLILWLGTLYRRFDIFDDGWFAERAYLWAESGIIRSDLFAGMLGWGERIFFDQKLFIMALGSWISFFGFDYYVLKAFNIPLLFIIGALGAFLSRGTRVQGWAFVFLLLTCGPLLEFSMNLRAEMLVAALAFASMLLLMPSRSLDSGHSVDPNATSMFRTDLKVCISGMCAGAALLCHLNGAIFMLTGALTLAAQLRWRHAVWYSLCAAGVAALYPLDAVLNDAWPRFLQQMLQDPAMSGTRSFSQKLWNTLEAHRLFFHDEGQSFTSLLVITAGVARWAWPASSESTKPNNHLALYLGLLFVVFILANNRISRMYYVLFAPFFCLYTAQAIALLVDNLKQGASSRQTLTLKWMLTLCLLSGVWSLGKIYARNWRHEHVLSMNARIEQILGPQGQSGVVVAPSSFVFERLDRYRVHGLNFYHHANSATGQAWSVEELFADAQSKSAKFLIFRNHPKRDYYRLPEQTPKRVGAYREIYRDPELRIYKLDDHS